MAGANAGYLNTFEVAHNAITGAAKDRRINVTTFHNWGHLNTGLVENKSSVTRVCPIKLVREVTINFRSARYFLERDCRYTSEYESEFTQPIGTLQDGSGTGHFVYIKIREELRPEFKLNFQYFISTLTVTDTPRLNVGNGQNT